MNEAAILIRGERFRVSAPKIENRGGTDQTGSLILRTGIRTHYTSFQILKTRTGTTGSVPVSGYPL